MQAHFYAQTPEATEQCIEVDNVCDTPAVGDKVKLHDAWWEVVDVKELSESVDGTIRTKALNIWVKQ